MSDDERAIRAFLPAWFDASQRHDHAALRDLLTPDMMFLTPGRPPFGVEEFMAGSEGNAEKFNLECGGEFEEVVVVGSLAHVRGKIEVKILPLDGKPPMTMAGYTLSVFRKCDDGRWRLARDANLMQPVN